jgi:two-component system sensor histidine kinase/response regulator
MNTEPALAGMRLVMLTAFHRRSHGVAALQAGFAGYLVKPIRQSQLYDCLVTVLRLPATPTPSTLVPQHRIADVPAPMRTRILVAEDNVVNQKVARRMLEKLGCRVDVVANGREALDALVQQPYDLVFMDCQMPEMDGYAATKAVREREQQTGSHIPIIAMTANALQGDRETCLEAGMDDYVRKPVQAAELLAMLQKWGNYA